MDCISKDTVIEILEIAECNLLNSLKGLQPNQIYTQVLPEINNIGWIFGHCAVHFHWVIDLVYQARRTYSDEVCHYYRYGTTKNEILDNAQPIKFRDLVDSYLNISKSSFQYLKSVDDEVIFKDFAAQPVESLLQTLNKVALHFMGHMGQIVMIRQALGNPGSSFVDGTTKPRRDLVITEWNQWWLESKEGFDI